MTDEREQCENGPADWSMLHWFSVFFKEMHQLGLWVLSVCGGLTLAGHQVPTKAAPSLPSSAGQGKENIMKGLCVKVKTEKDCWPITIMGKTDSTWGD